jgi:hypothetical protein
VKRAATLSTLLGLCLTASPLAATELAPATCEDRGTATFSLIYDRVDDRFVHFIETSAANSPNFPDAESRVILADCKAGWQLSVPADSDAGVGLLGEFLYGEESYSFKKMQDILQGARVQVWNPPFSAEHCACKVTPLYETHLVDD